MGLFPTDANDGDEVTNANNTTFKYVAADDKWIIVNDITVSNIAYNEGTWNNNGDAATKDAIRDWVELHKANEANINHITDAQVGALHAIVTAGDLNHNDLANLNAGDNYEHISQAQKNALHTRLHAITDVLDHSAGNHKIFYSDGSAHIVELPLGADGKVLKSNGPAVAPSWQDDITGEGSVSDAIYSIDWDAVTNIAPSKNRVYDQIHKGLDGAFDESKIIDGATSEANAVQIGNGTNYFKIWTDGTRVLLKNSVTGDIRIFNANLTVRDGRACTVYNAGNVEYVQMFFGDTYPYLQSSKDIYFRNNGSFSFLNLYNNYGPNAYCDDFINQCKPIPDKGLENVLKIKNKEDGSIDKLSYPECVKTPDAEGRIGLSIGAQNAMLIKAIQELESRIKKLEGRK